MITANELKERYPIYASFMDRRLEAGDDLRDLTAYLTGDPVPDLDGYNIKPYWQCNQKCIHCFNEEDYRDIKPPSLDEVYKQVDAVAPQYEMFTVFGGEPTLRNDLVEILKYIRKTGKKSSLNTNGIRFFNDEEYLQELAPYIDLVTLPVHSSDYSIFDATTQVKGSAEKVIAVFKKLLTIKGIMFVIQVVINRLNYKTLLDTFDMIQNIAPGIKILLTYPMPIGSARSSSVTPSYPEIREYLIPAIKKYGSLINVWGFPQCYLYPHQNDVIMIKNTHHIQYEDEKPRSKSLKCQECIFNDECCGVRPEYSDLYNVETDLKPVTVDAQGIYHQ